MFAPSSVETSTSTGSGDWLNWEGRGLLTSLFLSAGFHPALHSHADDPPALSEPLRHVLRRWGLGWLSNTGWTVWDHQSPETTGEGGGSQLVFFSSWFFICFFLFFFQNKTEPFCLIAPDTDCVRMEVSLCTWVGVCLLSSLVLFKLFWRLGGRERGGSAKQQRQFYIISSSSPSSPDIALLQTTHQLTVLNPSEQRITGKIENAPFLDQRHTPEVIYRFLRYIFFFSPQQEWINLKCKWWTFACNIPSTGIFLDKYSAVW